MSPPTFLLALALTAYGLVGVTGLSLEARSEVAHSAAADRDCSDFSNQAEAQRFFIDQGGPARDPHRLDGSDNDGVACESLPCPCSRSGSSRPRRNGAKVIRARVTSVVDGDTIRVRAYGARRKRYAVRLIGIDTPETKRPGTPVECGGKEATSNLLRLSFTSPRDSDSDGLLDEKGGKGRRVRLTTDPSQDTFDRYRRLLAYARVRGGGQLNASQVRAGWAKVYVYRGKPFLQVRGFRRAQRSAKSADRGVWGQCGGDFHRPAQ